MAIRMGLFPPRNSGGRERVEEWKEEGEIWRERVRERERERERER